jgi:hypothetical protein
VNLVGETVNRLDFALPAASLSWAGWPFDIKGRLTPDGQPVSQKTKTFSALNSGNLSTDLDLSLASLGPGWTPPLMFPASVPEPVTHSKSSFRRAPNAPKLPVERAKHPELAGPLVGVPAFGVDLMVPNLVTWPDGSIPGTWTVVSGEPGSSYFGGDFLNGDFSELYVVDYALNQLHTLDTATGAKTVIGPMTPNAGESWTGLKGSSDGKVYAVATTCSASTLYTVDPATGHTTAIGPITNGGCVIDIAINQDGEIYGVDLVSDNLLKINPATGAGTVVGPLGVDANYAQGMAFEKESGVLYWAAYTGSGELRTINTATGASFLIGPFPGGTEVDAFAFASGGGATLPWFSVTPTDGVVPAQGQLDILGEFFPEGVPTAHFGLFRAQVKSTNDSPFQLPTIPVYFTKAFWDVPAGHWADGFIHGLAGARITYGCGLGNYCPDVLLTRSQMAIFLVRSAHGPDFMPPPAVGLFADVPITDGDTTANYIEQLYNDGYTTGCATDPLRYCPNDLMPREQMAVFLDRLKHGPSFVPPPATGIFADVPSSDVFAPCIEAAYADGTTIGCSAEPLLYCPKDKVTRAQIAVFLVRVLGIPYLP